jgi:taurine--2-oxoglutarate transaminase
MCVALGHKNEAVIQAIEQQARQLAYVSPGYATDIRADLVELLLEVLPRGLEKFFFTTSGTDANEAAFKIARMVTGRAKIISRYRSYHGSTAGSIAATGDPRRWASEPSAKGPGVIFGPEVNCYKCPLHHTYPSCDVACASYIDHMIENENDVAAVVVEPIVGTNGVLIFWAVDLVKDPVQKTPFSTRADKVSGKSLVIDRVVAHMMKNGVMVQAWISHLVIAPPLIITRDEVDFAIGVMDRALEIADQALGLESPGLALAQELNSV